jgi:hypothetical protein
MGTWGAGLYSGDFAADLRAAVSAVARLPFDGDRLVEILSDVEPEASRNAADEDHTTFWLVVADQFARRGIVSPHARARAVAIIDSGADEQSLAVRGMPATGLAKRRALLEELRARIDGASAKARAGVLKKPQPFLMEIGDVFTYPTSNGRCINSYYPSKSRIPGWAENGWGAAVLVDQGRAFDFLTWYRLVALKTSLIQRPTLDRLADADTEWVLRRPGTCSRVHFTRLELGHLGRIRIDPARLLEAAGALRPGVYQAIHDISIANELGTFPTSGDPKRPLSQKLTVIRGLAALQSEV